MARPKIRSYFDESVRDSDLDFAGEVSMTKQADAEFCDINKILAKAMQPNGVLDHVMLRPQIEGDFTGMPTYQEALNTVLEAEDLFMSMPAKVRDRFANNPGNFLEFVSDPANRAEMASMGLLSQEAVLAMEAAKAASGQAPEGSAQA